jgi:uncharacterized protein (TIGR02453 family)
MAFFSSDFHSFFNDLNQNNYREWFHENKKRYEQSVKAPFYQFVEHMILRVRELEPDLQLSIKEAVFRINRDIRFSKDKSPYKTHMAAAIVKGGRKNMERPGLYFHMGLTGLMIASGVYMPAKENLYAIRTAIAAQPKKVDKMIADPEFQKFFDGIKGEKNKRLPKEFQEAALEQALLFNKQFYFMAEYPEPETFLRNDLDQFMIDHYRAGSKVNAFLTEALKR